MHIPDAVLFWFVMITGFSVIIAGSILIGIYYG